MAACGRNGARQIRFILIVFGLNISAARSSLFISKLKFPFLFKN